MKGFQFNGIAAGIKKNGFRDLGLIYSRVPAAAAAVFTKNQVVAAPVLLGKKQIQSGQCQAIIVNSGNANCFTGEQGMADARTMADLTARHLGILSDLVQVSSTGVIGAPLPMEKLHAKIPDLVKTMDQGTIDSFADAILTTDTFVKTATRVVSGRTGRYTVTGVAKGSGMIRPDMATMLGFVCTDALVSARDLNTCLKTACNRSFNRISVDGDTSTNDTVFCLANGLSKESVTSGEQLEQFQVALDEVCTDLARMIVRDGEGATKLVKIVVTGAASRSDAWSAAGAVAHSNLVKTAIYGQDPNWGRILAAAGRSGALVFQDRIDLHFNDICLVSNGRWLGPDIEKKAARVMKKEEFTITLDLNLGMESDFYYFCDFSEKYVTINADYRT